MKFARHRAKLAFMTFDTLIDAASLRALLNAPRSGTPPPVATPPVATAPGATAPGAPHLAIIDCRFDLQNPDAGHRAYLAAHIPGAHYVDLNRDLSAPVGLSTGRHPLPSPTVLVRRLGDLGVGDDTQVVAYDEANGSFAARLWWLLRWLGHDAVAVLDGGLQAWRSSGGALESGEAATPHVERFTPRPALQPVMSTAELEQALQDPSSLLVDARAAERFAGVVEPIDAVAGHIPGAVNHPFTQNLGADQHFLPAALLRERWQERLAGRQPSKLIAMCGSGVTACHNLLSLEVAGLPGATLYAGSWSEWIRDPRRPVTQGA
jgi:thiosulfate/3-mercaptopyruvate sulfurtransferase